MARILIIDDEQDMVDSAKRILVRHGHEVEGFQDARKAIEDANKRKPDLILMDLLMPQLSGQEAIKELKNSSDLSQIPIIIMTGLISPAEMTKTNVDGKSYKILGKPYQIDELIKAVKESLSPVEY
jgi:DNA-binding NtrC family response regulator